MPLGASSLPDLARGTVEDSPLSLLPGAIQALTLTTEGRLRVSSVPGYNEQIWHDVVKADNPFVQSSNPWQNELPSAATQNRPHAGESQ